MKTTTTTTATTATTTSTKSLADYTLIFDAFATPRPWLPPTARALAIGRLTADEAKVLDAECRATGTGAGGPYALIENGNSGEFFLVRCRG